MKPLRLACLICLVAACSPDYDVIIRGGSVYDGSGASPIVADVGIVGDTVAIVGDLNGATARQEVRAAGLAISPGFINMLSWATETLIVDGRSESDIRQGVTLEVFGEGRSMGPLNAQMKAEMVAQQGDLSFDVPWTTLGEYLEHLVDRGVAPNVASFVGATTVRVHELGYEDRPPTAGELDRMRALVRQAMEEGALGVGSALIYAAFYADTRELVELAKVASTYGGMYTSHIRDEGNRFMEAVDEIFRIAREAEIRAEIYHFKVKGPHNWSKLDEVIGRIEWARAEGLGVTANVYLYRAGSTGLNTAMPPWVQEGGLGPWIERLSDPAIRSRVAREMLEPGLGWNNNLELSGSADNVLLVGFRSETLKPLIGKTLAAVAQMRGTSIPETAMDLVVEDKSRVSAVYFMMAEENLRKKVGLPWVSFGSDGGSMAPEGVFLRSSPHPRTYGNFARLLAKYVRDDGVIPLEEAVRRLSALPAENLRLARRGRLLPGYYADIVVFDPGRIQDHASYDDPHRYVIGVEHVFVNGVQVLDRGEHTGALPGQVVRGPGWKGWGHSPSPSGG